MERKVKKRCYIDLEDATATEIVSLSSGDNGLWIGEEEWECEGSPVGNANGCRWECEGSVGMRSVGKEEWETKSRRVEKAKFDGERVGEQSTMGMWRIDGILKDRQTESSLVATELSAVEGTMTMTMASLGDGDKRRAQATATWDGSASSGDDGLGLVERVRERERIRWVRKRMGSEIKKKGLNLIFCVKLIVTTYISSLLATFSDEI